MMRQGARTAAGRAATATTPAASAEELHNHLGGDAARNYRRYEFDTVAPWCGRSLLEVGSGLGDFAGLFEGRVDRLVVSDNDPYCLRRLRERYRGRGDVEVLDLTLPCPVPVREPVDTIVAINVLEHVADDVRALSLLTGALVPGGRVLLWVPGYQWLYGDFDRRVGHVRRYTPATLTGAVTAAGLAVETCRPVNLLGGLAWWLSVRVGGSGYPNPRLVRLYDRGVVPLTRAVEKFVTPPFGQSVFCAARRPAR